MPDAARVLRRLTMPAAGALHAVAFAPRPMWWLQLIALAWLVTALRQADGWRAAAARGFGFGLGWFLAGIWWLYISMHDHGDMPAALAAFAVFALSAYLALYPALACALAQRIGPRTAGGFALMFAASWTLAESLRAHVFTGFPWLATGYGQIDGPLAGFAPWIGAGGVGLAAALVAALAAAMLRRPAMGGADAAAGASRTRTLAGVAIALLIALGAIAGQVRFTRPIAAELPFRLLQGNVPQNLKFDPAQLAGTFARYGAMITAVPAALIVTPETALPVLADEIPAALRERLRDFARETGSQLLLGAVGWTGDANGMPTNSAFGIDAQGVLRYRYDKRHLVPFGEFIPFGFQWFVDAMRMPLGNFARGAAAQPAFVVQAPGGAVRIGVNICYEDIFGDEIARSLRDAREPAQVLVNMTNLAWFDDTVALDQHLQMARMRTLETQRPMLRATNTGATVAIDAEGRVIAALPHQVVGALTASVRGTDGLTPYVRGGELPLLVLVGLILAGGLLKSRLYRNAGGREAPTAT